MGQLGRRRASRVEVADPGKFNPKQLKPRRFHPDDACDGTYVGSSTKTAKVLGLLDLGFTVQGHSCFEVTSIAPGAFRYSGSREVTSSLLTSENSSAVKSAWSLPTSKENMPM